ncbi:MAG: FAD-dependent oxidoreductase [Bacteroides sp.]|nr:FAD-dependent oxidoreductase [Bacteroides sp.]
MITTQVLIIGQGLAGSLLAWELWKHGVNFMVMDPGLPNTSSKAAAGLFHPLVARKILLADKVDVMLPALRNSYKALEDLLEVKLLFKIPSARLILPQTIPEWTMAKNGELSGYITRFFPAGNIAGLKHEKAAAIIGHSGFLEVAGLIYAMARWLREKNRLINNLLDYEMISFLPGRVFVNGLIQAEQIVFCEGPGALQNPWFKDYGLLANKGEVIEIIAEGLEEQYIIRDEVFILPLGQHRFRVGATYSHQSLDYEPTEEGLRELREKLDKILEVPYEVVDHWAGMRPVAKDRSPVMGFHPLHPQLAIFNGLGSKGVIQAPWYAAQLRRLLTEKSFSLPKEVNVSRFFRTL